MKKLLALTITFILISTISMAAQHVRYYDISGVFGGAPKTAKAYECLEKQLKDYPKERIIFWSFDSFSLSQKSYKGITILTEDIK